MEKDINTKNTPPKAVKPRTEEDRRKRRLAWICGILALLNLIALALLILLPFNCKGTHHNNDDRDTVVIDSTIYVSDTSRVVEEEEEDIEDVREIVDSIGGNNDGFMQFTITWNKNGRDIVDLDAHAIEPTGHIFFEQHNKNKGQRPTRSGGELDIDMQRPREKGAENITWPSANQLADGKYEFYIDNYTDDPFSECTAMLRVGNKSFLYKVGHFSKRTPVKIAVVTIKNHQVEDIKHFQQPISEE
ncbi:MAG: hypothetical protein IKW83_11505 [Muribaculaceae bacterium]|nr:hypothetical protein [Muribaculaceae bacterium]